MKRTILMAALLAGTALATPASADNLKFYSGGAGYTGAFSGLGTIYNAFTTNNVPTTCANNGACGTDVITSSQVYGVGTDGLTATANTGQNVWDDNTPNFGGLGVGVNVTGVNDNIDGTNVLTLTFNAPVQLTGVATLFDTNNHGPFGNGNPLTSSFLLNGVAQSFAGANTTLGLNLIGQTFTFAENGVYNPSFYVSGVTFIPGQISSVPGPVVGAGIPGLITAAFGLYGLALRRRRRHLGLA